jgi:hypothetical protein
VRRSRWALALKGASADRLVVLTAFVVVLLAASLMSAIPIYANAVAQSSLRERLRQAPTTDANLQATVYVFGGGGGQRLDRRVRRIVRDVFSATPVAIFRSSESEPFTVDGRIAVLGFYDGQSHPRQSWNQLSTIWTCLVRCRMCRQFENRGERSPQWRNSLRRMTTWFEPWTCMVTRYRVRLAVTRTSSTTTCLDPRIRNHASWRIGLIVSRLMETCWVPSRSRLSTRTPGSPTIRNGFAERERTTYSPP